MSAEDASEEPTKVPGAHERGRAVATGTPLQAVPVVHVRVQATSLHDASGPLGDARVADFAGTVRLIADSTSEWTAGDEVFGWAPSDAVASGEVVVPQSQLLRKPPALAWPVVGGLYLAAELAFDAVRAIGPHPIMAVGVAGADSLPGIIAVQLLQATHAHAVAIVDARHADWFRERHIRVAEQGEHVLAGLRAAAPHGLAGFIDLQGSFDIAPDALGVTADQVFTVRRDVLVGALPPHRPSTRTGTRAILERIAGLVEAGLIEVPIAGCFPPGGTAGSAALSEARQAFGIVSLTGDAAPHVEQESNS